MCGGGCLRYTAYRQNEKWILIKEVFAFDDQKILPDFSQQPQVTMQVCSTNEFDNLFEEGSLFYFYHTTKYFGFLTVNVAHAAVGVGLKHGRYYIIHDPGNKSHNAVGVELKPLREELAFANYFEAHPCDVQDPYLKRMCQVITMKRAYSLLGNKDYHLLFRNCEVLATYCFEHGFAQSPQIYMLSQRALRRSTATLIPICAAVSWRILRHTGLLWRSVTTAFMSGLTWFAWYIAQKRFAHRRARLVIYDGHRRFFDILGAKGHVLTDIQQGKAPLNSSSMSILTNIAIECATVVLAGHRGKHSLNPMLPELVMAAVIRLGDANELILQHMLKTHWLLPMKEFSAHYGELVQLNGLRLFAEWICGPETILTSDVNQVFILTTIGRIVKRADRLLSKKNAKFTLLLFNTILPVARQYQEWPLNTWLLQDNGVKEELHKIELELENLKQRAKTLASIDNGANSDSISANFYGTIWIPKNDSFSADITVFQKAANEDCIEFQDYLGSRNPHLNKQYYLDVPSNFAPPLASIIDNSDVQASLNLSTTIGPRERHTFLSTA